MGYDASGVSAPEPTVGGKSPPSLAMHGAGVALLAILSIVVARLAPGSAALPPQVFVPIDAILEMITVFIAISACVTIARAPGEDEVWRTALFGASLFAAASLSVVQLMTMTTMPGLFSDVLFQRSRTVSLASSSLLCGALLALSISPGFRATSANQRVALLLVYALAYSTAIALIVAGHTLLTRFPVVEVSIDWVFSVVLGFAAFRFAQHSRRAGRTFFPLMFAGAAIAGLGHLLFSGEDRDFSIHGLWRNVLGVIAYWCIYRAIFDVWVRRPFQLLTEQAATLRRTNSTLRFQAMALESAPASIVLMDATGQVTWQNRASLKLPCQRGGSTGDAGATPVKITRHIQHILANTAVWRGRYHQRDAGGALRYYDQSITAVKNADGLLEGYVSVADDITDTITGELRYKRLLETAQDGFAVIDLSGNYLEVNESFARMVGYPRDELLTMNAQDLFVGVAVSDWLAQTAAAPATVHPRYNSVITQKNGNIVQVQSSVTIAPEEQQFFAFIHDSMLEDQAYANQRELENQLLHAQKVHALGELTGGIAHDFNNILGSIVGYSNLALDRFVPDKTSKLAQYLTEVVSASERARDLIAKMLTFTRAQPNRSVQDIGPEAAVAEMVAMLRPSIASNIGIKIQPGPNFTVRIDAGELNQMLVNLTINARDAIAAHGAITVGWEHIDATGRMCAFSQQRLSGRFAAIYVSDTGCGIEDDTLARIFDPYFTTKDVGKGSGLGLPMVQGIMHRAGGHVLVDSQSGIGTTFWLLFPGFPSVAPSQLTSRAMTELPPQQGNGELIWVIDDDAAICRYMDELLGQWGYQVQTFHDPAQAWTAFQAAPHDAGLVISDQTMPGMTGTELIGRMQQLRPNLAVLICSGRVDEVALAECDNVGVLRKPVDRHQLLRSVAERLEHNAPLGDR